MPLYVYRCPACGHEVELIRPASDRDAPVICNAWWSGFDDEIEDGPLMERVQSSSNFVVRGFNARNGYAKQDVS